jgi:hypothetical protein
MLGNSVRSPSDSNGAQSAIRFLGSPFALSRPALLSAPSARVAKFGAPQRDLRNEPFPGLNPVPRDLERLWRGGVGDLDNLCGEIRRYAAPTAARCLYPACPELGK